MRNPDWTTLPTNPMERIGSLLIADDVSDFVRLRSVCHPWRSSTVAMKNRADRLYPHNWIMLSDPDSSPTDVRFFNTSTHKSFSFNLTPYLDTYSLFQSFDSLFLLEHKLTGGFALLNPFMKSLTLLPSKIESTCTKAPSQLEDLIRKKSFDFSGVFVTSSSKIVLLFSFLDFLVWTKPGDQSWVYADAQHKIQCFSNVLFYKDRLLTIDGDKGLMQINLANEIPNQLQVEVVIPRCQLPDLDNALYLVECGGEIFLVTFLPDDASQEHFWESFEMSKLDLNEKTYVHSTNLGNYSVFLGENRTLSVSCDDLSSVPANSIYFCNLYYGDTACYNLRTNRLRYQSCKPFLRPSSLVKKLIGYCLRSHW
ncbi:hypothetical protein LUZ61_017557 [Rhynchospora tenuis]|uniref:KIB1-4 beta-propeller domain-containing protein n=1 Tax=Rhynchospora tenuis TaxID=198213 RepID=A0AAD5Z7N2_9POAL|nr:hypothetical protein LUZ61_017557 [Rhynchospora tenuis]